MDFDAPEYYSTLCPVDLLDCDRLATPQDVIDHVVAEHDPRIVATVLVREAYINRRLCRVLEGVPASIEHEIDMMVPDPIGADIIGVETAPGEG
jgi:hypothetical protein